MSWEEQKECPVGRTKAGMREDERESESGREMGFELIACRLIWGSNYETANKGCTRTGVPESWHISMELRAGSCSRRVRK